MSDDKQVNQPQNDVQEAEVKQTQTDETKQSNTFTQEQLDNIIKQRLEAEKAKQQRQIDELKKAEEDALKEKQIQEAKTKADLEKLMQERISAKDNELSKYKNMIKEEKVDNSIMSVASKNDAIAPSQVVSLLKNEVNYKIEVELTIQKLNQGQNDMLLCV